MREHAPPAGAGACTCVSPITPRPPLRRWRGSGGEKKREPGDAPEPPSGALLPRFFAGSQIQRPVAGVSAPNLAALVAYAPPAGPGEWGRPPSILFFLPLPQVWGRGQGVRAARDIAPETRHARGYRMETRPAEEHPPERAICVSSAIRLCTRQASHCSRSHDGMVL